MPSTALLRTPVSASLRTGDTQRSRATTTQPDPPVVALTTTVARGCACPLSPWRQLLV